MSFLSSNLPRNSLGLSSLPSKPCHLSLSLHFRPAWPFPGCNQGMVTSDLLLSLWEDGLGEGERETSPVFSQVWGGEPGLPGRGAAKASIGLVWVGVPLLPAPVSRPRFLFLGSMSLP